MHPLLDYNGNPPAYIDATDGKERIMSQEIPTHLRNA